MKRPTLTTEAILTHPDAFGLATATPVQRAICRVLDGLPLGDLAEHPDVIAAFGGPLALSALPSTPPHEAHILASIRSAKSQIAAAHILRSSQTVDMSKVGIGDLVTHFVLALTLGKGTRAVMSQLVGPLKAKPLLRRLVVANDRGEPQCSLDRVVLRHPSGREVEVLPVPIDRAGGSVLSVWSAGITVDEEPRMLGAADAVRNLDEVRDGVMGRLLGGAQYLGIGSPHAPSGPVFELYEKHFGKPSGDVVIAQAPGPVMNPFHWTAEECANLQRRNPRAYKTDCLAQFADGIASVFTSEAIARAVREQPELDDAVPILAVDMSSGRGDSAVAIPLAWSIPRLPREAWLWSGRKRLALSGDDGFAEIEEPERDEHGQPVPNPEWKGEHHAVLFIGEPLAVGSSRVDLQACKLEYSIVSPK